MALLIMSHKNLAMYTMNFDYSLGQIAINTAGLPLQVWPWPVNMPESLTSLVPKYFLS